MMKRFLRSLGPAIPVLALCLASACALAPVSTNFTGRSLGSGKVGLDGGAVAAGSGIFYGRLAVGLGPNMDFGAQYDMLSAGLFAKYSIINNRASGFSLAGFGGAGIAVNGYYVYGGPALSFKAGMIEPYFAARINWVHYGENKSSSGFDISAGDYSYLQFTAGSVLWFSQAVGLNAEFSYFSGTTGSTQLVGPIICGGLKLRL